MNRITRVLAASLSLSLILSAPGLVSYQAAAQTMAGRGRLPTAIGSGTSSPYGSVVAPAGLPLAASLQTGLIPTLSPSAVLTPVIYAPAVVDAAAPALAVASALKAIALPAAATAEKLAATPVRALAALKTGGNALTAAAKNTSADAPRVALDGLFEGAESKPEALAVSALSAPADAPHLAPSDLGPAKGPRWVKTFSPEGAPRTSIKRTLSVGLLAAVIPIALTMGTVVIAQLLGYHMHPNYQGPDAGTTPTLLSALALWIGAAVMAPVSEEAIFRGGLQGRLAKLSAKLHLGSFVAPAVITSVIFVALHETSDPVLFATRFVHALILSYVYQKEGILASMAAHGFFNGLLALSIVLSAAGLPWLGLAVAPLAIYFAVKARRTLKAQQPDIASGALAPKTMSAHLAFLFAGVLMLGYFFIMPNIFWPLGAVALLINGALKLRKKA